MNNTGIIAAGAMIMIGLVLSGLVKSEGEYGMSGRFTLHELRSGEVRVFEPRRVCRRLISVSYAAMVSVSIAA
jgi:hypothetical protein